MLSPDRVKPLLRSEDPYVRDAAADYFAGSWSRDPELVPMILEAARQRGPTRHSRGLVALDRFPLTEQALDGRNGIFTPYTRTPPSLRLDSLSRGRAAKLAKRPLSAAVGRTIMRSVRPPNPHVPRGTGHDRLLVQARRRLHTLPRSGGRAWINGREVGGPDARYGHLGRAHD